MYLYICICREHGVNILRTRNFISATVLNNKPPKNVNVKQNACARNKMQMRLCNCSREMCFCTMKKLQLFFLSKLASVNWNRQ